MKCPHCQTDNRDDRTACYHCQADLSLLRTMTARSRNHYARGLEHAERGRLDDAIRDLQSAVELDASFANAWLALGTLRAHRQEFELARAAWERALAIDDRLKKAHDYLNRLERVKEELPGVRIMRRAALGSLTALLLTWIGVLGVIAASPGVRQTLSQIFRGPGSVVAALILLLPLLFAAGAVLYQNRGWFMSLLGGLSAEESRPESE